MEELFKRMMADMLQQALPQIAQAVAQHLGIHGHAQANQNTNPQAQAANTAMFGGNPVAQGGAVMGANPQSGVGQNTGQPVQGNMFAAAQQKGTAPNTATVTPDMIQQLITPLVQNEQVKNALTSQMQAMGIQNLPDARPDQLAELYQRFQQVDQQARAAGLIGGAAQQNGQPSII